MALPLLSRSQNPGMRRLTGGMGNFGRGGGMGAGGKADSLQHRTGLEDSITIRFRYLDTSRFSGFDSTVQDFTLRFPLRWHEVSLGNYGNAVENRYFSPLYKAGWDPGFHAYDRYAFTVAETRFYNTTRPYTELGYMLGSQAEQWIQFIHTQNINSHWNASLNYRMINSPGTFQNQNTSHNNYRFTSWYQSKNKRYQNFFVLIGNKLASGENGGIKDNGNYLDSTTYLTNRFIIPTKIGGNQVGNRNLFSTNISTGNFYTTANYLMRQQYDIGQKDSLVINDTTVVPLFYPRLRLEHTISYNTYNYRFKDQNADSTYYKDEYGLDVPPAIGKVFRRDLWKELFNDFSLYTFPDAKNAQQFLKLGASYQALKADFDTGNIIKRYNNLWVHGEYRNRTRNKKWELEAYGEFYLSGLNSADYKAFASLQRYTSNGASVTIGMENVNRRPSFVFNSDSHFYLDQAKDLNKENSTRIFASWSDKKTILTAQYQLLSNYTYFKEYYKVAQEGSLFTLLQLNAFHQFRIGHKGWHWRSWLLVQQKTGSADLNVPLISTRNQVAYDGTLGFKNLRISFGGELRYFTPYKANGYSPVTGQFYFQDKQTIRMRMPELSAYVHFRIRSFVAYVRGENLNALNPSTGSFTRNNVLLPDYPSPGLQIRVGIFWAFVN